MVAKRLAACSGMDYAIMSGGDVGPLGKVYNV
jgi:ATPase family AAA domain-containing protein 3A/B